MGLYEPRHPTALKLKSLEYAAAEKFHAQSRFARNRASGYNSIQGDARSSQPPHLQVGFPVHGSLNDNFAPFVGPHASNLKIWMSKRFINGVVARFIGTKHERDVKELQPLVEEINALEPEMRKLSDAEITAKTAELKTEVQARMEGLERDDPDYKRKMQEALQPALVPAFALVREAGRRTLGMRHFDVQLIGGIVLHEGKISEMKTGEGKTLVATLPAYLNALTGKGVHIVTVNDYLARRDAEWMGPIYKMLGLSVGVIVHDLDDVQRRAAYAADITYGTNNEFGFDYLRDNMKYDLTQCVQRGHHFAIVDEVDSILIDEARTPLIISGPAEESTDKYYRIDKIIPKLILDIDYTLDEKHRTATLTEEGVSKCEQLAEPRQSLRSRAHGHHSPRLSGLARAHALSRRTWITW